MMKGNQRKWNAAWLFFIGIILCLLAINGWIKSQVEKEHRAQAPILRQNIAPQATQRPLPSATEESSAASTTLPPTSPADSLKGREVQTFPHGEIIYENPLFDTNLPQ